MTPMPADENGRGQPEPTLADLGLTPGMDPHRAPDWFMLVEPEPRYLCDEFSYEWQLSAGPSAAALDERARELATHIVLRTEIENRDLHERNEAQAHELARLRELRADAADRLVEQLNQAQRDADFWTEKYYDLDRDHKRALADLIMKDEVIADLREGLEAVRAKLRDYGYISGSLLERLEAMHRELLLLQQRVDAQSGAQPFRPLPPPAA